MAKYEIQTNTDNCTGCLRCALACSDLYSRCFNPLASRIRIVVSDGDWSIDFTEDCNECGICVDHCFFGAVQKERREAHR